MVFENVFQNLWKSLNKRFYFRRIITQQINCVKPRIESAQFRQLVLNTSRISTHKTSIDRRNIKTRYCIAPGEGHSSDAEVF